MNRLKRILQYGVLPWLGALLIWQLASMPSNPDFLPGPYRTLQGAIELAQDGSLLTYIIYSFYRVFTGWLLGSLIAIPVGLAMGRIRIIRAITEPILNFVRFIPALAFITLFMLWFGIGEQSKIILIMYGTIFTVIINTMTGVLAVEEDKIRSARSMGASEWQILLHVIIPATIPYMFTGVRLAMSTSYMAILGAEMVAANEGVGFLIWNARLYFKTDWIFVGLIALGLMGFATDRLLGFIGRKLLYRYGIVFTSSSARKPA
ncbi:NitT/TauT family transport system permease protein [Paenibacillus phyllosphaerae]|uniref:NitT/TauT family transport system permease protein n=1 Tax=Paenibacillus phyllosphaerae TaxID=274593 RepID=A0A7W5FL37_9BACL|nr:ABC transporter permease [Paenibacillus phyllosphaerae]MBB3108629.1 NitT/TauT family transport system permease protein [Paenibacillus phyllosphaerae]